MKIRNEMPGESKIARRALTICQAILARQSEMRPFRNGFDELRTGPFTILHAPPESYPNGPWHNINIWREGQPKLANIEWNESDGWAVVGIVSFRGGEWEDELLSLLTVPATVN